jgi:hypothetical protein
MTQSTWRLRARQVIGEYCKAHPKQTASEFRKGVKDVYPFGEREHHPYKIWLDEVKRKAEQIERTPTPESIRNYWLNNPKKPGGL